MKARLKPLLYKRVEWHGLQLDIPQEHVAVAADRSGWVYSYAEVPVALYSTKWFSIGDILDICQVDLEGVDWRDTLVEYPL